MEIFSFFFQTWTTSRASTSLPSMSVIGSAQPDVVRIKVYVRHNFYPLKCVVFLLHRNQTVISMIKDMKQVHRRNFVSIHVWQLIKHYNVWLLKHSILKQILLSMLFIDVQQREENKYKRFGRIGILMHRYKWFNLVHI